MLTTEEVRAPVRRKPKPIEFAILRGWHAILSGAFIVAYASGDEDTYAMHQFAGYAVLAALVLRLIAALVAPQGSPLRLRRPELQSIRRWFFPAPYTERKPPSRRMLLTLMAAALLVVVGVAAVSGAIADVLPLIEDLHGALGDLALWVVLTHVAVVVAVYGFPKGRRASATAATAVLLALTAGSVAAADPARDAILAGYAQQARRDSPGFEGFSADRGRDIYRGPHAGGNSLTPSCAACHSTDPGGVGRHVKTGRAIEPMAVSVNPRRFTNAADVEKRFARDCPNVLGRPCTPREKGDFVTFLSAR